jgi:exonuclease VII large subunit
MDTQFQQLETESKNIVVQADKFEIVSQNTYEEATTFLKGIKSLIKKVEETFNPIVEKTRVAWREAIAQKEKHLLPLEQAESLIKNRIGGYLAECEKKRRQEEERLRLEAEEKARKERERLEARAEKVEAKGNIEKAESLKERAEQVEAFVPTVAPTVEKVNGQFMRKIWDFEVIDFALIPREYLMIDGIKIRKIIQGYKGKISIPGIRIFEKNVVVQR